VSGSPLSTTPVGTSQLSTTAVEVFYDESKAAHDFVDELVLRYRERTTTVLALATGAATFFGFSNTPKGPFFVVALVAFGVAALVATVIYWPGPLRLNVAHDVEDALKKQATTSTKLRWDLARGHQEAIQHSRSQIGGFWGLANKFRALLIATALVVVFAGFNSYLASRHATTTQPTHVVVDPIHVDTDPVHIVINPTQTVVLDPIHIDIGKGAK